MARIFIDGFEGDDTSIWDAVNSPAMVTASTYSMDGNYALTLYGGTCWVQKNLTAASEYYFAFWFNVRATNCERVFEVRSGTTTLCSLWRTADSTGVLKAYSGYGSTLLATGTATTPTSTLRKIGIYIKIDDSVGRFKVVVDGITDIDYTGDTKPGADTTINNVVMGARAGEPNFVIDNFIIDSASMPTDTRIQAVVPTGAGTTTGYTASTGSNYACVDEVPYSDTDYISVNTADAIDSYATGNLTGTIGSVKCVQLQVRARYEGSTAVPNIAPLVRSNSTDYPGANQTLSSSYAPYLKIWETDPATSAAWTESGVNAMEIGVKARA